MKKILLIGDNDFTNLYFRDIFWMHPGSNGDFYEVETKRDLNNAREYLDKEVPDLIFLEPDSRNNRRDKEMTKFSNANQFLKDFTSKDHGKRVPIIMYSDFDNQELAEEMVKSGAEAFIVKGKHTAKDLVDFVDQILSF